MRWIHAPNPIRQHRERPRICGPARPRGRTGIERDIAEAVSTEQPRRVDALRLVDYKLKPLKDHLSASRRLLNDLRMLRRLLIGGHEVDGSHAAARGARRSQPSAS